LLKFAKFTSERW